MDLAAAKVIVIEALRNRVDPLNAQKRELEEKLPGARRLAAIEQQRFQEVPTSGQTQDTAKLGSLERELAAVNAKIPALNVAIEAVTELE